MGGQAVGSVFGWPLADVVGRKKTAIACSSLMGLILLVQTVMPDIYAYSVLRGLLGFFARPAFGALYCIFLERLSSSERARFMPLLDMTAGFTSMLMGLSDYLFNHWRVVTYVWGAQVGFCGLLCFLVPESEEWLKSQSMSSLTTKCSLTPIGTFFKSKMMLSIASRLAFVWSSVVLTFYGLNFNAENLAGEIWLNFVYLGVMDATMNGVLIIVSPRVRRKPMLIGLLSLAGLLCLASGIAKSQNYDDAFVTACAYCGKFFISGAYSLVYLFTAELFPTSVRYVIMLLKPWSVLKINWLLSLQFRCTIDFSFNPIHRHWLVVY